MDGPIHLPSFSLTTQQPSLNWLPEHCYGNQTQMNPMAGPHTEVGSGSYP